MKIGNIKLVESKGGHKVYWLYDHQELYIGNLRRTETIGRLAGTDIMISVKGGWHYWVEDPNNIEFDHKAWKRFTRDVLKMLKIISKKGNELLTGGKE